MPTAPHHGPARHSRDFALHLLALGHIRGVGVKTLRALIDHYSDLSRVWDDDPRDLTVVLDRAKVPHSGAIVTRISTDREQLLATAADDLYSYEDTGLRILGSHESDFPARLAQPPGAPYWLFVQGNVAALHTLLIGVVGTRTPSQLGIHTAERLGAIIGREGLGIVSGLAEGIDASVHRAGLYYRAPQVAVLGTGIDIVFPTSTAGIRSLILDSGGAVITEFLPGDNYNRANFVQRNRIQAALARALAPVESRLQSGTAHTVRFAEQYHRPIFGVRRGDPAPTNELYSLLLAKDYPTFDLAVTDEVTRLIEWLQLVLTADAWPPQRRQLDTRWFFQDLLRQIDDIMVDVPLTPQDAQWLQEEITRRIQYPPPPGEERLNGHGH